MEVSELTIWIARLGVLILMYGFLLALVLALRADARATDAPAAPAAPQPARPTPAPTLLTLVFTNGTPPITGTRFPLQDALEIGRDASCAVAIQNGFVSSRHARVYPHDGAWLVQDLGSTNGTLLNGQPVQAPQRITHGDRLVVGDTEFLVD